MNLKETLSLVLTGAISDQIDLRRKLSARAMVAGDPVSREAIEARINDLSARIEISRFALQAIGG